MLPWDLARSVTARQFATLRAYWKVEPFGFPVDNFRHGMVANTIARVHGAKTKVEDYYPEVKTPTDDTQTQRQQMSILSAAGTASEAS